MKLYTIGNKVVKFGGKLASANTPEEPVWSISDFNYLPDVIKSLKADDKIAILMRHAERGSDYSKTGGLTENGKLQALQLGQNIHWEYSDDPNVCLVSTNVKRTIETAYIVAYGMGLFYQYDYNDLPSYETMALETNTEIGEEVFHGDIYKTEGSSVSWELMSKYAYEYENLTSSEKAKFKDTPAKMYNTITQSMDNIVNSDIGKKINIFVSHDMLLEPLTVTTSNNQIDLKFYEDKRWITYLAGIARIYKADGTIQTIPVRGLNKGYQTGY